MIDRAPVSGIRSDWMDRLTMGLVVALLVGATGCSRFGTESGTNEQPVVQAEEPEEAGLDPTELRGLSEEEVIGLLGKPTGQIKSSSRATWDYPGYRIVFASGKVSEAQRKVIRKRTLDSAEGNTIPVSKYSRSGAAVDIKTLMPAGKITIIDFYADWCGPCIQISPHLEAIAKANPDVVLRKVDIVKWKTPVTKQYGISSIPDIRVYDANKQLIGKARGVSDAKKLIGKAK